MGAGQEELLGCAHLLNLISWANAHNKHLSYNVNNSSMIQLTLGGVQSPKAQRLKWVDFPKSSSDPNVPKARKKIWQRQLHVPKLEFLSDFKLFQPLPPLDGTELFCFKRKKRGRRVKNMLKVIWCKAEGEKLKKKTYLKKSPETNATNQAISPSF